MAYNLKFQIIRWGKFKTNNQRGFTLLELIVGVGVFSIVVLSSTAIFQKVIDGQRLAIAAQNTQESLRYTFEVISKEVRMALEDSDGTCTGYAGKTFHNPDNTILKFKNQYEECVAYKGESGRFKISRVLPGESPLYFDITPNDINVSYLRFYVKSDDQPAVTIIMRINNTRFGGKDLYESQMDIQTTISSRFYLE